MSRLLISKKGVSSKLLILFGLFFIVITVLSFAMGSTERHFADSDFDAMVKIAAPILTGISGILCIARSSAQGKTYINVYDDHVEGVGLSKAILTQHNFHFNKTMNYTVQISGSQVKVSCGAEAYQIFLTAADAQQVYQCIYGNGAVNYATTNATNTNTAHQQNTAHNSTSNPKPNTGSVVAVCPHCGTKCRVPSGRGLIRITCPNAKCKVPFTFDS